MNKTVSVPPKRKKLRAYDNATFLLYTESEETEDNLPIIGRAGPKMQVKPSTIHEKAKGNNAKEDAGQPSREESAKVAITKEVLGSSKHSMQKKAQS